MKFAENFAFYKIPEWSEYYFDYYSLKLILYYILHGRSQKKSSLTLQKLQKHKSSFGNNNNTNINNKEYTPSEAENFTKSKVQRRSLILKKSTRINEIDLNNLETLEKLRNKLNNYNLNDQEQNSLYLEENNIGDDKKNEIVLKINEISGLPDTLKLEYFLKFYKEEMVIIDKFFSNQIQANENKYLNIKYKMKELNLKEDFSENLIEKLDKHEREELDYASSFKRALSSIYNFTSWLHSYHSINLLAIQKIKMKAIKIFKKHNIKDVENTINKEDKKFQFFDNLEKVIKLRKDIQKLYAECLTNGNIKKAKNELELLLRGSSQSKQKKHCCLFIGMIFIEIIFYIFLCINDKQRKNSVKPFFPSFNFSFCIILTFLGLAINLEILQRYKINYLYIFQVEPTLRMGSFDVLKTSLAMLSFWFFFMICAKITYNYSLFGHIYYLFPLISSCSLLLFLFLPLNYFYYDFRMGILKTFVRNFLPLGKNGVRFRDFFFGDILTSLSKAICSLALAICLFSCQVCRNENKRISKCNRDTIYCLIIQLYFPFVRAAQCLNRFYYTKSLWPHFANFIKYIFNLLNVYFSWNYSQHKNNKNKIIYIIFGVFATLFQLIWDIFVDWGIGRTKAKFFLLRDKIFYPKIFYYIAVILDTLIRFSWLTGFIDLNKGKYDEWKTLFLNVLEVYRRIQWSIIRIENENNTNPEKYRDILTIPELPEFD